MFQIAFSEILLVCIVAVIFLKPKDYPIIAKKIHKGFNKFRKIQNQIYKDFEEIKQDLEIEDLKDKIRINELVVSSKIIGDDGNEYETFEMPEIIKKSKIKRKSSKNA